MSIIGSGVGVLGGASSSTGVGSTGGNACSPSTCSYSNIGIGAFSGISCSTTGVGAFSCSTTGVGAFSCSTTGVGAFSCSTTGVGTLGVTMGVAIPSSVYRGAPGVGVPSRNT